MFVYMHDTYWFYIKLFWIVFDRLERAKKLQEQREKEMVEKQKQQEMAAGNLLWIVWFLKKKNLKNTENLIGGGVQGQPGLNSKALFSAIPNLWDLFLVQASHLYWATLSIPLFGFLSQSSFTSTRPPMCYLLITTF